MACTIIIVKCSWDDCLRKKLVCVWSFWCSELCSVDQTVTVQRGVCWMWGSRVILPALCTDKYSLGEGRVVPMIRSTVRTTLRSLLRSDLVAELNQTVIDVQRTDSMMAEQNCFSSSCGRLNFSAWRKYSLCWAFFTMDSMWSYHFRSWDGGAQESEWLHCSHVLFMMVNEGISPEVHDHLHTLSVLSSRLLKLHQTARS